MTITINKRNAQQFLTLMDALEMTYKNYLERELCEDVKLNVVRSKLVLTVSDTLPGFIRYGCQQIFDLTLHETICT